MTTLKTLRDLDKEIAEKYFSKDVTDIIFRELKQEAIKWVKTEQPKLYGIPIIRGKYTANEVKACIKNWIEYFFNLTEEDLK